MTCDLPLLLSLEATAATSCSSRYMFTRPHIGQEKIWLPWEVFLPQPGSRTSGSCRTPSTCQRRSHPSLEHVGQGRGMDRAQSPLPLPLFELLVAVLAAEAAALAGAVPHVSAAAGVAGAQPLCRGLLRHLCDSRAAVSHTEGQQTDRQTSASPTDTRQHLLDAGTHPTNATTVPLP